MGARQSRWCSHREPLKRKRGGSQAESARSSDLVEERGSSWLIVMAFVRETSAMLLCPKRSTRLGNAFKTAIAPALLSGCQHSSGAVDSAPPDFLSIALPTIAAVIVLTLLIAIAAGIASRVFNAGRTAVAVIALGVLTLFGLLSIPLALPKNSAWIEVELIAIGLLVVGGFFGFLFGLPTVVQSSSGGNTAAGSPQSLLSVNTHLDDVTAKIASLLAGVALASVLTIPQYIGNFNDALHTLLGIKNGDPGSALGIALLLYFPPIGFVISYLIMRVQVSPLLARADAKLQLFDAGQPQIWRAPPLPDISDGANADQTAAARSIAAIPYASLTDLDQKATWARANALLGNYSAAERAYQDVRVLNPRDYRALIDYATVIYNDPEIDDIPQILSLLNAAEKICPKDNLDALSRLKVLRAAAYLYQTSGYENAIIEVNSVIATKDMPQPRLTRFYRACGFGQLFWALQAGPGMSAQTQAAIAAIITNDSALTLAQGDVGRTQLLLVTVGQGRENPVDNDLQAFAAADAPYQAQLQISAPAAPAPPAPPAPVTITDAAITAGWITTNCLT